MQAGGRGERAEDCLFCRVVRGELPSYVVLEDELTMAFLDLRPAARGHTLVVPRGARRAPLGRRRRQRRGGHADRSRRRGLLRDRLRPDGLTLRQNTGGASGQVVPHLHLHLVPRWHGDGTVGWPWPPPADVDLDEVLAVLRGGRPT